MADRIILKPITTDDLAAMDAQDMLREIVDGQWNEERKMTGKRHGSIEATLIVLLQSHVKPRKLGRVYSGDTTYILEGTRAEIKTMRMPDVSFVVQERLPDVDENPDDYYYLAPDLAIEIISPSERPAIIAAKVKDYLRAGTQQVWLIYPERAQVIVHFADGSSRTYEKGQKLSAGDVIPGFEIAVAEIFEV